MSMWSNPNKDAKSVGRNEASSGARLGFLQGIEAGYDEAVRYSSSYGAERALQEEEAENIRRITAAGGVAPEALDTFTFLSGQDTGPYSDFLYNTPGQRSTVDTKARNEQLKKLQEQYPDAGILTYDDMFGSVRKKSDEARRRAQQNTTLGGAVGGFLGSAVGGVDPRVNPIGTAGLAAGGFGRTVVARIATEAGAAGVAEAINQVTGVQTNQRLLGGDPGLADAAIAVGGAAVAGGLFQGAGEGIAAGARRWFRPSAVDQVPPAPERAPTPLSAPASGAPIAAGRPELPVPPSTARLVRDTVASSMPGGTTRTGRRAAGADLDSVAARLDTWTPDARPWQLAPPTSTRIPGTPDLRPNFRSVAATAETVDDIARQVDPATFTVYDKLAAQANTLRAEIASVETVQTQTATNAAAEGLRTQIDQLQARTAGMKPKQRARAEREIAELEAQYEANFKAADATAPTDTAGAVAAKREQLMKIDERMRDLAPTVSRAYARARNEWVAPEELKAAVDSMIAKGDAQLSPGDTFNLPERMPDLEDVGVQRFVPELSTPAAARLGGKDALDTTSRVMAERAEIAGEALEAFRAGVGRALADAEDAPLVIEVNGRAIEIDGSVQIDVALDADDLSLGQRAVSARDLFRELDADNEVMKAVTTCQIR